MLANYPTLPDTSPQYKATLDLFRLLYGTMRTRKLSMVLYVASYFSIIDAWKGLRTGYKRGARMMYAIQQSWSQKSRFSHLEFLNKLIFPQPWQILKAVMLRATALLLAVFGSAAALRIKSVTHSGPACPQSDRLTWSGGLDDLTITLPDFSETIAAGQTTSCQVHLLIDEGDPGKALLLQDVTVSGGLYLSSNTKVDFYTTAYWSETASDTVSRCTCLLGVRWRKVADWSNKVAKSTSTASGSAAVFRNVDVAQRVNSASPCTGSDGYVGILNVAFRIISQGGGLVFFGKERKDVDTSPVVESLAFKWQSC
ncbi:hypothetical protein BDP55DRAFT_661621 [Colletotrichum godetiae]|uniref:Uncharacterized protein n=1 Tax=Colletotrichum godetiae TaxID=1209918 RepID=A0AAJ0AMI4_9PEZI|nr:uncharacterized protein BDP55DRAFT_661621 [Colletotrichum godetiae]KAK1676624.1 hypothetical protein BDP55DRAFT_661621 [Colletotrichum godetiae]